MFNPKGTGVLVGIACSFLGGLRAAVPIFTKAPSLRCWLPALLPLALVAVAVGALLHGCGRYYFGPVESDLIHVFYPWRVFLYRWFQRGVFPFRDPHVFGGYPVLETQQMLALNPIHFVSTAFISPKIGLLLDAAGQTLVAALATLAALRGLLRCSVAASALGVCCYVFGAVFAMRVGAGHLTVTAAMAWWPLATAASARVGQQVGPPHHLTVREVAGVLFRGKHAAGALRLFLLLAGTNAMVVLAGAPQYVVYLFWVQLFVVFVCARWWLGGLIQLAGAWVVALVLTLPQWLPFLWYLPFTGRATGGTMAGVAPEELKVVLLELLFPFPLGDDLGNPHLYMKAVWETCTYPGVLPLVLTLGLLCVGGVHAIRWLSTLGRGSLRRGVFSRLLLHERRHGSSALRFRVALATTLLGLYLTTGHWLPGFSSFREPLKARAIVALSFAFGSAAGYDLLRLALLCGRRSLVWMVRALAALLVVGAVLLYRRSQDTAWFLEMVNSFPASLEVATNQFAASVRREPELGTRILAAAALHTGVAALLVFLLTLLPMRRIAIGGLLLVGSIDPFLVHLSPFHSRHPYTDDVELRPALARQFQPLLQPVLEGNELPWRTTLPSWLINRSHLLEGLYETGGYDPIMPATANNRVLLADVGRGQRSATGTNPLVHQALGRRYACGQLPREDLVSTGTDAQPCARVHDHAQITDLERKLLVGSPDEGFGPSKDNMNFVTQRAAPYDALPPPVPESVHQAVSNITPLENGPTDGHGPAEGETLTVESLASPNEITARVKLVAPALLLYRTTWLPGWQVWLDGEDTGALCANGWMLAAAVPAGEHRITFRYRPVAWIPSVVISAVGWIGFLALLWWALIQHPRRRRDIEKARAAGA